MIYFIQRRDNKWIKIGHAKALRSRMCGIAKSVGLSVYDVKCLGIFSGAREEEKFMHQKFSHLRVVGEWFRPHPELVNYIRAFTMPPVSRRCMHEVYEPYSDEPSCIQWIVPEILD